MVDLPSIYGNVSGSTSTVSYFDVEMRSYQNSQNFPDHQANACWAIKMVPTSGNRTVRMQVLNSSGTARDIAYSGVYTLSTTIASTAVTSTTSWASILGVYRYDGILGGTMLVNYCHGPDAEDVPMINIKCIWQRSTYAIQEWHTITPTGASSSTNDGATLRFYFNTTTAHEVAEH